MLKREDLHGYQLKSVDFILEKQKCALFLSMGLGKSITTLTAITDLIDSMCVNKVLITAPLRVVNTVWEQEASNWEHTQHLRFSNCTGSAVQRESALKKDADVYLINVDVIPWLVDHIGLKNWPFDAIIFDESSLFKSHSSKRFKAMKKVLPKIEYSVLLTGTPSPNGLMDLWSQVFLVDSGHRLGKNITAFRNRWFEADYMGYNYNPRAHAQDEIQRLISDVTLSMQTQDYIDLPDRMNLIEKVELPSKVNKQYKELEKEFLLALDDDTEIEAPSAAAVANKLVQLCSGSIYTEAGEYVKIHDEKLKALKQLVEDNPTENILVAYNYKFNRHILAKEFSRAQILDKDPSKVVKWNEGKIPMLLAHPASAGHGLNLQRGGTIMVWFDLTWNLEHYQQMNARLHRQGQTEPVRIIHLIATSDKFKTMDEKILEALSNKDMVQSSLIRSLK